MALVNPEIDIPKVGDIYVVPSYPGITCTVIEIIHYEFVDFFDLRVKYSDEGDQTRIIDLLYLKKNFTKIGFVNTETERGGNSRLRKVETIVCDMCQSLQFPGRKTCGNCGTMYSDSEFDLDEIVSEFHKLNKYIALLEDAGFDKRVREKALDLFFSGEVNTAIAATCSSVPDGQWCKALPILGFSS